MPKTGAPQKCFDDLKRKKKKGKVKERGKSERKLMKTIGAPQRRFDDPTFHTCNGKKIQEHLLSASIAAQNKEIRMK